MAWAAAWRFCFEHPDHDIELLLEQPIQQPRNVAHLDQHIGRYFKVKLHVNLHLPASAAVIHNEIGISAMQKLQRPNLPAWRKSVITDTACGSRHFFNTWVRNAMLSAAANSTWVH